MLVRRQMYLAATMHREVRGRMPTISANQAMEMGTINGAKSLGIDEFVGSIEVGKRADIVVHDANRPELRPGLDPVNTLVGSMNSHTSAFFKARCAFGSFVSTVGFSS